MCELTGADQRRPLGIFTNINSFNTRTYPGWPSLSLQGNTELTYEGPLPPSCQCLPAHPPIRGFNEHEEFCSSSSLAFGKQFWWYTVASYLQPTGHSVLRSEELSSSCPSPSAYGFSFASSSGSKSQLYVTWCSGMLTKAIFGDYGGSTAASMYFAGTASLLSLPGCRISTSSTCCSSGASSSCFSSCPASSGSRGPSLAPLVASPPRGDVSDGRVATPGVSSGSVHARQGGLVWCMFFLCLSGSVSF